MVVDAAGSHKEKRAQPGARGRVEQTTQPGSADVDLIDRSIVEQPIVMVVEAKVGRQAPCCRDPSDVCLPTIR